MIKVKEEGEYSLIISNVTEFSGAMGYCEYKIPLLLEGVTAPPTIETIEGAKAHIKAEKYEQEHFEFIPISVETLTDIENNVEFAREKIFTRLSYSVTDNISVVLHGRADKVFRNNRELFVQEDKFPSNILKYSEKYEPYPDQKLQALAYLNSEYSDKGRKNSDWFSIPYATKNWIIRIIDKSNDTPFRIFQGTQNLEANNYLLRSLERFALIIKGEEEIWLHKNKNKCIKCRLFNKCRFRYYQIE